MARKADKPKSGSGAEIVVFSVIRETKCTECGAELWKGSLLRLEGEKALCTSCADLDRLEFLPSGDAAVTRRASKYSTLRAVVVRWSRTRKRYERQGILVEPEALLRAEEESLADAELRARRQARAADRRQHEDHEFIAAFARAIREQYPGCPAKEETDYLRRPHSLLRKPLPDDSRMMPFVPDKNERQRADAHLGVVRSAST